MNNKSKYTGKLIGKTFGRFTVIGDPVSIRKPGQKPRLVVKCRCECGAIKDVRIDQLLSGESLSCGCLRLDRIKESAREGRMTHIKYGESRERIHNIWNLMLERCNNPEHRAYRNYGGRDIKVCDEWDHGIEGYMRFKQWSISNGYTEDLTIDRIDNNGNYSPDNCRWISNAEQQNNKRNNVFVEYNGETHTASQWARIIGMPMNTLHQRLRKGWSAERALTEPLKKSATSKPSAIMAARI